MSENRQKYSSSPLYGLKHSRGGGGGFQVPDRPDRSNRGGRRTFVFLQVAMSALLPILFIVALILGYTELHWAFLALSALALLVMWAAKAFVPQARQTMTLIYVALMIVSLAAAVWFTKPLLDRTAPPENGGDSSIAAIFGRNVTSRDVQDFSAQSNQNPTATPTTTVNGSSLAQQQLELFMNSWMSLDYDAMLSFCSPAWVSAQENPQHAIFKIRGTSTPVSYEVTAASGTEADDSRTLTMIAEIDKGTGRAPQTYRYEVLMLRVNGVWYVDPASLSSATEVKDESTPTPTFTLMPTYTVDADLMLYYNPDGGKLYHKNDQCTSVAQKYLPLKGSFHYSEINESAYKDLSPCTKCGAPKRPD